MMKEPTIENFLEFEKKYKCNSIKVEGMPIWSLYRYEIHNEIKKQTVGRTAEGSEPPINKKDLLTMALNALKPFNYRNVDVLFVCDGRRSKNADTGVYENIYLDEISKKFNSVILEQPENRKHSTPNGMDNVYFTDRVAFKTNLAVKLSTKFNTPKRKRYEAGVRAAFTDIFKAIKEEFGPDITDKMVDEMVDRMYYYEITKKYCGKILDKAQPKLIVELCYYLINNFAMSELGKERGIPTAEYAHGFAFPTHTPMQFNPEERISVLPDYHLTYSKSQEDEVHFPDNVKLVPVGFPFFERERDRYKAKYPREEKTIVFISALAEGEQISKMAAEVSEALGDEYRVIYKLHPKEFGYYKERFPWLANSKVEVIDNSENHMFRYLAESGTIVCTRTAALQEGIGFGCRVILLNFGDTALNLKTLIEKENIPLVDTAEEITDLIKNNKAAFVNPNGMYEPNAIENLTRFISEIMMN
ncbi:hypothetical protein [Pseudobutyrivibrio xylanivorans]|uniref:Uncharacterized protein n=1 Tax=Pseudobutyrivibrio xylanivorans TaxID=185007 RepID=A0A1G5RXD9_PSEXY|nr:hypothetical protein [Pseudobutyrivibrio xylanivorans]SCZ78676.1 hypothetical protein SAMN02910350_01391 [Pseudobutyrivibrio xylanivorans]